MKIKKYLMIMLAALTFAACGSDDKEDETPAVDPIAELDYSQLMDTDVKTITSKFGTPSTDMTSIKMYEKVSTKVSDVMIMFNTTTNSVCYISETIVKGVATLSDINTYFGKTYKSLGMVDGINTFCNKATEEESTLVIGVTQTEEGDIMIYYTDPTNMPQEEEAEGPELTANQLAAFVGQSWVDVEDMYGDYLEDYGGGSYGMSITDDLVSMAAFTVTNGAVANVIIIYDNADSDNDVLDYYKELGYTVTANGKDDDGQAKYTISNDTYTIDYAGARGVVTKK